MSYCPSHSTPYDEPGPPCGVCGNDFDHCICPDCLMCGIAGDPECYGITGHGLFLTIEQAESLAAKEDEWDNANTDILNQENESQRLWVEYCEKN